MFLARSPYSSFNFKYLTPYKLYKIKITILYYKIGKTLSRFSLSFLEKISVFCGFFQQILGRESETGISTTRLPPEAVLR